MLRTGAVSVWLAFVFINVIGYAHAERKIALTYDDAPRKDGLLFSGSERTDRLIDALKSVESGPVGFFVTTKTLKDNPVNKDRITRYAAAGHLIANHTHTHPWAHKTQITIYLKDIDRASTLLKGTVNLRPWFRFPYLDEGRTQARIDQIAQGLKERNLTNGYVTIDNFDWYIESRLQRALREKLYVDYEKLGRMYIQMMLYAAEYYDNLAIKRIGYSPVHVLLLHENDIAALYADDLVRAFRQHGWEIVSPDLAYNDPLPEPKTTRTGQGRLAALAIDNGSPVNTVWTWAIDEQMIDVWLDRSGVFSEPKVKSAEQ